MKLIATSTTNPISEIHPILGDTIEQRKEMLFLIPLKECIMSKTKLNVNELEIVLYKQNEKESISLTDMAKANDETKKTSGSWIIYKIWNSNFLTWLRKALMLFKLMENLNKDIILELKNAILQSRYQAARLVNKEMIVLFFEIGKKISLNAKQMAWGSKVLDQISSELQKELPGLKGFSNSNLK